MINPYDITNYNRNSAELQEFLLFTILVAGKTAYVQAKKLDFFLNSACALLSNNTLEPFDILEGLYKKELLREHIVSCKLGQYKRIFKSFEYITKNKVDLNYCTTDDLESIPGVGPKTSRFFLLHSRKSYLAVLDVHILKWLSLKGYVNVPKTTPSNTKKYKFWENVFLDYCTENNEDPAQLDLLIWKQFAKKENNNEIKI